MTELIDRVRKGINAPKFLNCKEAIAFLAFYLEEKAKRDEPAEFYGSEIAALKDPLISDTVFMQAANEMGLDGFLSDRWQKVEGRGRPRRVFSIAEGKAGAIAQLAQLWRERQ